MDAVVRMADDVLEMDIAAAPHLGCREANHNIMSDTVSNNTFDTVS
jgi:hypothetical protein